MNNQNTQIAYLTVFLPDGEMMHYKTTEYAEVFQFKRICKQINCDFSVRFKDVPPTPMHVVKNKSIQVAQVAKRFFHWFCLR